MSAVTENIPAERETLGAMLVSEPAAKRVIEGVGPRPEDFYLDRHRAIYQAMVERHPDPIDETCIAHDLNRSGNLDAAGGAAYVSELAASVAAPGNVEHHARIVFECALERASRRVASQLRSGEIAGPDAVAELTTIENQRKATHQDGLRSTSFNRIAREKVRWLWKERVPLGMLTLLMGDPGLGKSLFTTYLAAPVTRAGGNVLLLTGEDDPAATIRPRLEAADADLARVHTAVVRRDGMDEGVALPDDGADLQGLVNDLAAKLIVVDPLMAFLPESVNSWKDQSVRRAIAPLYAIARDERCAILIVAHLNKGRQGNALHRAGGSIGIPAAVRSALLLARDPGDPERERGGGRILAHVKCNVGPQRESLTFQVGPVALDDGDEVPVLKLTGTSDTSAAELLDTPDASEAPQRDEAEEFILTELADGPVPAKVIRERARNQMISERTLKRAKATLRVTSNKVGLDGWEWALPERGRPSDDGEEGRVVEGDQPYIRPEDPFNSRAKNQQRFRDHDRVGGHGSDIAVAHIKSSLDAEELTEPEAPR